MNELVRWTEGGTVSRRTSRAAALRKQYALDKVRETAIEVDGLAALYTRAMDRTVDVDTHRRNLASNDESLHAMLTRLELDFVSAVESKLRQHGSDFGI